MLESVPIKQNPKNDTNSFVHALIPENLHTEFSDYLHSQRYIIWPNPYFKMHVEQSDVAVENLVTAHMIGFISLHAVKLRNELNVHGLDLEVLPQGTALLGLKRYYETIRYHPDKKEKIFEQQKLTLREPGIEYAEPHILMHLHRDINRHVFIYGIAPRQHEYLKGFALPDSVGGIGTAIHSHQDQLRRIRSTDPIAV